MPSSTVPPQGRVVVGFNVVVDVAKAPANVVIFGKGVVVTYVYVIFQRYKQKCAVCR